MPKRVLNPKALAVIIVLLGFTSITGAVGTFTLQEIYPAENVTATIHADGSIPVGNYSFRIIQGGLGDGFYGGAAAYTTSSPPSHIEAHANTTTGNQTIEICWDASNYTGATANDGAWMFAILFTTRTNATGEGDYEPYDVTTSTWVTNHVSVNPPFTYYSRFARKTVLTHTDNHFCYNWTTYTTRAFPIAWDGIGFVELSGGTTADPITPYDLYNYTAFTAGRPEFIRMLPMYQNYYYGAVYQFYLSTGTVYTNTNTVFNIPKNIVMMQTGDASFKMNSLGNFTMGVYDSTYGYATGGGVYLRNANYPAYNYFNGAFKVYDSYFAGGYDYKPSNPSYWGDHYSQFGSGGIEMVLTKFEGAGRLNSINVNIQDTIFDSQGPETMTTEEETNKGWHDLILNDQRIIWGHGSIEALYKNINFLNHASSARYILYAQTQNSAPYTVNSTRTSRLVNPDFNGVYPVFLAWQNNIAQDYQFYITSEYDLSLKVVDSVTGAPIENATLTIQDVNGSYAQSGYARTVLGNVQTANYHLYEYNDTYFEVTSAANIQVGDYLKMGMEFVRVNWKNATWVNVTRGEFNSTQWGLQMIHNTGNNATKVWRAWREQYSDSNGEFELARIVNQSWRLQGHDFIVGSAYINPPFYTWSTYGNYSGYAPFVITVNASGYNNFTTYYTPTQENAFTIGLINTTECPDCPASITGGVVGDSLIIVNRKVAAQPTPPSDDNFDSGLLLGGVLAGFIAIAGLASIARKRDEST